MNDNKRTRQIGPLQPSVGGHQSCSDPRNDNGDEANATTTASNSEEYQDKAAARLNLDEEQALEPPPVPIHKSKRPSLHHVSVLKHQERVQLPQTIIKHETAVSDEKMMKDQADIEQPSAPPRQDKCAQADEPKETSLDADDESETSFSWVVPPRTRLAPSTPGNGRAVIPGAFEVTLRPPPSNDFSQYTEQDMAGVDNVAIIPGNDANSNVATDEILQLTSATLVDEDREHALEMENERLRKRVEGQTQAVAIAVNDSTNKMLFWKTSWFYLIMGIAIVGIAVLIWALGRENDSTTTAIDLIANDPRLSTFARHLESTGLVEQLRSQNDVTMTIFAPTNDAFQYLPGELRYQDPRGVIHMRGLLSKHCVQYDWMDKLGFVDNTTLTMKNNETVLVSVQGNVNQPQAISLSPAIEKDQVNLVSENAMLADNGDVVHVVDGLLKPNFYDLTLLDLAQQLNLTWILVFAEAADVVANVLETVSDLTFLCPVNGAEQKEPPEVWERVETDPLFITSVAYTHIIRTLYPTELRSDKGVTTLHATNVIQFDVFNDNNTATVSLENGSKANIVLANQIARNGIIHVLDGFLIPDYP